MSARKSSHRTIFLLASSGPPLLLIAASLRSTSKKPFGPVTRPLHLPIFARGYRVRFAQTWREEFFEGPLCDFCNAPEFFLFGHSAGRFFCSVVTLIQQGGIDHEVFGRQALH